MKKNLLMLSLVTASSLGSCVSSSPAEAETVRTSAAKKPTAAEQSKLNSAAAADSKSAALKPGTDSADPAKIQPEFQNEFARQLAAAGPKAEGWALFSEAGMSFPGQRWIIRTNTPGKDAISLCEIKQTQKSCTKRSITKKQFDRFTSTFAQADKLSHLLPTSFDGINFEYLHARTGVPTPVRVVFISSATPFPPEYEAIVTAFTTLATSK
jgi:hypothetical protein